MSQDPISKFCEELATFCNHLQSSSDALKESIDRRPIPLDSASSTFVQCLNSRVSSASADLDFLDSMTFGTVSFEELLGHCNEIYKKNQTSLLELEDRLKDYGYVPDFVLDTEEEEDEDQEDTQNEISEDKLSSPSSFCGSLSMRDSSFKSFEDDALLDESLSLKKLGLSDACMATLASEGNLPSQEPEKGQEFKQQHEPVVDNTVASDGRKFLSNEADKENLESAESPSSISKILKSEFECLPAYMRGLASWEDLLVAVDKINSCLSKKTNGGNFFRQDEIPSLDLGPKARSYLLLLVRMNRLVVEKIDGLQSYKVL